MKIFKFLNNPLAAASFMAAFFICQPTHAADRIWSGAGTDDFWSTAENWDALPIDGDTLHFSGSSRLINTNDLSLNNVAGVNFDSDGFVLNGNSLSLTAGVTNSVGTNIIALNANWTPPTANDLYAASGTELQIAGTLTNVNGTGNININYKGGGRIRFTGLYFQPTNQPAQIINNAEVVIDGGTFMNAGGLRIASATDGASSAIIITNGGTLNQVNSAGAIRVGDLSGTVGTVVIDNSSLIMAGGSMYIPFANSETGAVIQRGGTNTGGIITFINGSASGTGSYDMSAGAVLETTQIKKGHAVGTATMSFDEATIRPLAASTTFFTGIDTAEIKSGGLTFDSAANVTVAQVFSGAGGLTKTGAGTLLLSSTANSYAGDTTIRQGILQIAGASTLGNGAGTLNLSGGILQSSASRSIATPNPINLTDDSTITTTATGSTPNFEFSSDSISGTNGTLTFTNSSATTANTFRPRFSGDGFDFSRPVVLANGTANFTELNLFNVDGTEQIFSGQISGNGSINRSVSSGLGGNTILTAANTFSGGITLTRGNIGVGDNNALGSGAITPNGGGIFASGGARSIANDFTFSSGLTIGGSTDISFSGAFNLGSANRNITVTNSAATTISGSVASTVASGSIALTKFGSSILEISSDNSYAGDTVVSEGTLKVSNSTGTATGSGTVIVTNTGVLSGAGTVGGIALSSGGKAAPGNSVGILNAASANFGEGGSLQIEISDANTALPSGTGVDLLNIQGALTINADSGAPFVIDVSSIGGLAANFDNTQTYSWIIAKASGGITGFSPDAFTVSTANFQNDLGSKTFSVSTDGSGNLLLNFGSVVPPQPTIDSNIIGAGTGDAQLSWSSVSGASYTVQYKTNLNQVDWLTLTNIVANDTTTSAHDTTTPVPSERYYRVISP